MTTGTPNAPQLPTDPIERALLEGLLMLRASDILRIEPNGVPGQVAVSIGPGFPREDWPLIIHAITRALDAGETTFAITIDDERRAFMALLDQTAAKVAGKTTPEA